ncbi:MAG: type II toxin-antitoxin system RelE family toxin [Methanosarcina sp.]
MPFKVFIKAKILDNLPQERRKQVKEALKDLKNGFQGDDRCRIEGYKEEVFRVRIGNYRGSYTVDFEENVIIVFDVLTAEQSHKKYGRL